MKKQKKKQTSGKCIFCGSGNLSKQHILPNWLNKALKDEGSKNAQQLIIETKHLSNTIHLNFNLVKKQGKLTNQKIRKFCATCNNGWMSRLETECKPYLLALINGEAISLTQEIQLDISRWIIMTSIVAEYTDVRSKSTSEEQISIFYKEKNPTDDWNIWIGRYDGKKWEPHRYRRHGAIAIDIKQSLEKAANSYKNNTQYTTIVIGQLLIHVMSSTVRNLNLNFDKEKNNKLFRINPVKQVEIKAPFPMGNSDEDAMEIADHFFKKSLPSMDKFLDQVYATQ